MQITGRAKTSIYQHIRNIPLSAARMGRYRQVSGQHIRKFALARKGKSTKPFRTFNAWTPQKVLLVGHLIFDGEILRARCVYNNRSKALLARVRKLMMDIYDYEPARYVNPVTGVTRIMYYNVELSNYLHGKAGVLLKDVGNMPIEMKREFLRAFFDDEGCMDFLLRSGKRRIRGYQKDTKILKLVSKLLADIGIESRVVRPNEVMIVGKENLLRFKREINFSSGVCINGARSNSRWKKNLEKRVLLKQAIESFKR